jgi:hypothetical protein
MTLCRLLSYPRPSHRPESAAGFPTNEGRPGDRTGTGADRSGAWVLLVGRAVQLIRPAYRSQTTKVPTTKSVCVPQRRSCLVLIHLGIVVSNVVVVSTFTCALGLLGPCAASNWLLTSSLAFISLFHVSYTTTTTTSPRANSGFHRKVKGSIGSAIMSTVTANQDTSVNETSPLVRREDGQYTTAHGDPATSPWIKPKGFLLIEIGESLDGMRCTRS